MYVDKVSEYSGKGDKRYVKCSIISTNTPSPLPTTGENIVGLGAEDNLDMGSTLFVTNGSSLYVMDENHVFQLVQ